MASVAASTAAVSQPEPSIVGLKLPPPRVMRTALRQPRRTPPRDHEHEPPFHVAPIFESLWVRVGLSSVEPPWPDEFLGRVVRARGSRSAIRSCADDDHDRHSLTSMTRDARVALVLGHS